MASSKTTERIESAELTLERLAEITGHADAFEACHAYLARCKTPADLRAAGGAIKPVVVAHLEPEAQEALRGRFMVLLAACQNEVKPDALDGKRVTIVRARYVDTSVGPTFRLRGTYEEIVGKPREFECWCPGSSRGPVYRFFERRAHDAYPVDVCFRKEQHPTDPAKTMWTVEQLARPEGRTGGLVPF